MSEVIEQPQQTTPVPMPTETPDQRMERLANELDEWCRKNGVVIEPVAIGRKTGRLANIADWEPDSHIFSHALAPRQQQ